MTTSKVLVILALSLETASAQSAADQNPAALPAHAIVRAWRMDPLASPRYAAGRLITLAADSVVIASPQLIRHVAIPRDSVARLEFSVRREDRARNGMLGAAVGAVALGTAGYLIGGAIPWPCDPPQSSCNGRGDQVVMATIFGAGGALIGAGIGTLFPGRRIWHPMSFPVR